MAADQADELRQAMQRLFRRFGALAADATPCGKPLSIAHAHALMILAARDELSQQELGRELNIDKSNVARLCARMVELGQARQRPSPDDGRSRMVSLSARGKNLAREIGSASHARFDALLAAIPRGRQSQIIGALNELVAAVDVTFADPSERQDETE